MLLDLPPPRVVGWWLRAQFWMPHRLLTGLPPSMRGRVGNAIAAGPLIALAALGAFGASGSRLHLLPDHALLIDAFFRSVFPPIVVLLIVWSVAALRFDTTRADEWALLRSLPLSNGDMHWLLMISEWLRLPWVPAGLVMLMLAPAAVVPVAFLARASVVVLAAYLLLQSISVAIHLVVSLRGGGRYPARNHALVQGFVAITSGLATVLCVLYPAAISGRSFFTLVGAAVAAIGLSCAGSRRIFERWNGTNRGLTALDTRRHGPGLGYRAWSRVLSVFGPAGRSNPLLVKNLVRSTREGTLISRLAIATVFVIVTFLVATNNEAIDDVVRVMSGMFGAYAFIAVTRTINRLGVGEEPVALLYSMPLSGAQLYLAVFVPLVVSLAGVAGVLALLVLGAGGDGVRVAGFLYTAVAMALVFATTGVGAAVISYPRHKDASLRFLLWMLVLAMLVIVFYRLRIVVLTVGPLITLMFAVRKRFYRRS